jgi:hypothetical protein
MKHVGTFGYTRHSTPLTALAKERNEMWVDAVPRRILSLSHISTNGDLTKLYALPSIIV